jgi:energy-coupling factor transport system ATP-binding protein
MISKHLIFDEVALGPRLRGWDETRVKTAVIEALKVCGLYPFRSWPINALSYGQKKACHDRRNFGARTGINDLR